MEKEEQKLDVTGEIKINREHTRTWIAKGIFILFVVLVLILILISCLKNTSLSDYNIILSPLVGLLGVILGFYFGKESE